jgi:predicted  nucleic acid-binding Zn-ribbon protein
MREAFPYLIGTLGLLVPLLVTLLSSSNRNLSRIVTLENKTQGLENAQTKSMADAETSKSTITELRLEVSRLQIQMKGIEGQLSTLQQTMQNVNQLLLNSVHGKS